MRIAASLLMISVALPAWADVSPFPIEDEPQQAQAQSDSVILEEAPAANPDADRQQPSPANAPRSAQTAQDSGTAQDMPDPAPVQGSPADTQKLMDTVEPQQPSVSAEPAVTIGDEPANGDAVAVGESGGQVADDAQPDGSSDQDGTQADAGSSGSVAEPETQASAAEEGTAAENAGTTGWTGGTGGSQIGTTPSGAVPQSRTWQPPVATGIALQGEPQG